MTDNFPDPAAARVPQQPDEAGKTDQASQAESSHFAPELTAADAPSQDASQRAEGGETVEDYSRLPQIDPASALTPKRRNRLVLASSAAIFLFVLLCGCVILFICSSVGQFQPQP